MQLFTEMERVYRDGVCTEMKCTEWNVCIEVEDVYRDRVCVQSVCVQRWNVCDMEHEYGYEMCVQSWSVYTHMECVQRKDRVMMTKS